ARNRTRELFSKILSNPNPKWAFNQSPLFLEFLMGRQDFECTPWGMVTYNIFGWQKPCYLLDEGYVPTFQQLLDETEWARYGYHSGNPRCANCMVHSGYEATAVDATFSSFKHFARTVKLTLFGLKASRPVGPDFQFRAPLAAASPSAAEAPVIRGCAAIRPKEDPAGGVKA
ncbi:MAG: DUF3463 domain-containing protein, partial [Verrucomicrobiae bacterium]|nr:DUF3463 domain-containing protein [Verrucomicrobiae bacterium]